MSLEPVFSELSFSKPLSVPLNANAVSVL